MSDRNYFVTLAWRASVILFVLTAVVIAAMPRSLAPDVAEAIIGVAAVLAMFPRLMCAVMRWFDRR